jgi:hypothetical protein
MSDTDAIDLEFNLFVEFLNRVINVSDIDIASRLKVFKKIQDHVESCIYDYEEELEEELEENDKESGDNIHLKT